MSNKMFLKLAFSAGMATNLFAASSERPNVVLILADDLGIGGLHCYGTDFVETPNIDKLASEGMMFMNGLAAYPTCRPSRAAILTGQYGPRTGIYRVCDSYGDEDKARYVIPKNHQLNPKKLTIGKMFKSAGYTTAMYGKWHVSNEHKVHPHPYFGFDEAYASHGAHYNAKSIPPVDLPKGEMIESLFTGMAGNFMQKAVDNNKPFFIYMPYFLVHAPFEARQDYIDHFQEKLKGVNLVGKTKKQKKGKHSHSLATVLAMTKMLDDEVGRLLGKLDELGVRDNTVVLFTSDNGSYDRNLVGGYRGRKGDTYDGGMRVPYIFRWPGKIAAGSKSNERIIGVDIYPTLLSLAGIPLPKPSMYPVDGVDISPILLGKAKKLQSRNVFCCYPKYARFRKGRWAMSWRNVVYNGSDKLIEYPEYDEYELFSLDDDPKETKDLSKSSPEKRAELTKILHRWLIDVGAPPLTPNPDYKATPPKK